MLQRIDPEGVFDLERFKLAVGAIGLDQKLPILAEEAGMQTLRDTDVLATLVFLQRLEIQHNNGRRRGRAFFDFLRTYFPEPAPRVEV